MTERKTPNPLLRRSRSGGATGDPGPGKPPAFEAAFDPPIREDAPPEKKLKYTILLTPTQRDRLRLYAAHRDVKMSQVITEFIETLNI